MDGTEKALTGIIVAAGFLSLTIAPTWSMAFLILFGMIRLAAVAAKKMMRRNQAPAANNTDLAHDAMVPDADAPSDAASGNPESSSTPSSSSRFKYDVFLNFARFKNDVFLNFGGLDTCNGIVDHLYKQLNAAEIRVFSDEYDLAPDKEVGLEMTRAIKQSRILIAIFSKNFAASEWCLTHLVQMWNCRKTNGQSIIPIFYDVSPMDVREQSEHFGDALQKHKERGIDSNTMKTWKEVLGQSAELEGFTRLGDHNGHDGELVKEVARVVQSLKEDYQFVDKLVGIDHHVQEIMRKLGVSYCEGQAIKVQGEKVQVLAICGVRGVGKTTLAKAVYNKMRKLFEACSFIEDVGSEGVRFSKRILIADLKKQMHAPLGPSSEKIEGIEDLCQDVKVLIVLDDVNKDEQIEELVGNRTWFGSGSSIIVTTNEKKVLKAFDKVEEYTVKPMDQHHAHKLFCKHAFQGDAAQDVSEYFGLSLNIAKAIGGLPRAIVKRATLLREGMDMTTWKTTLNSLQKNKIK